MMTAMVEGVVAVFQRAELAALRAKREEEEEIRRSEAKRDKLFVASSFLLEIFTSPTCIDYDKLRFHVPKS